jgi:hypothetical protein
VRYIKKSNSFEVLDEKQLIGEIKNKLGSMKLTLRVAKANAEAKSRREILSKLPPKYVLKRAKGKSKPDDLQLLLTTMKEVSPEYYSASSTNRAGVPTAEFHAKRLKIRKQVIDKLEEYVFVEEEEDGTLTKMSNDEVDRWISDLYTKRDYFTTEKKSSPVQKQYSRFDATEDKQIITFGQQSIKEGFSFESIPWDMLVSEMKERDRKEIARRAKFLLNNDGSLRSLLSNDGKEWAEEEDKILHNARSKGDLDLQALSSRLGRSERMISKRLGMVTFDKDGNRITRSTVSKSILGNRELAKDYLGRAKLKPEEELSERQILTGCQIHAYGGKQGRNGKNFGYSRGISVNMMGITVQGPPLHQAAATVGSGARPAPTTVSGKKRKSEASHKCKDGGCTNPKHLKWEDGRANMHRNTCVGMIKFNVGGKIVMVPSKECTCDGRCLNYVSAM